MVGRGKASGDPMIVFDRMRVSMGFASYPTEMVGQPVRQIALDRADKLQAIPIGCPDSMRTDLSRFLLQCQSRQAGRIALGE